MEKPLYHLTSDDGDDDFIIILHLLLLLQPVQDWQYEGLSFPCSSLK
jgi:hypothetical protein